MVCSEAKAERLGVHAARRIVGYGQVAGPDASLLDQPANAINAGARPRRHERRRRRPVRAQRGLRRRRRGLDADLGITDEVTNVNGGAIALGHPIGMSGNRVALHLLMELTRRGGGIGAAALCGGGGQGDGILLETI